MYGNIEIRGARENNLKEVSLDIPKRKITVFTGVSGSGKSSIVFDTIGAEAQRALNDTFTMFQRNFLPKYGQPHVDRIANLSTPIIIGQKRIGGNQRSTVGTITDIYSLLRLLYSRAGEPSAGYSDAYSFNLPAGMCPVCDGIGHKREVDLGKLLDMSKSLNEGAILHPQFKVDTWQWKMFALSGYFDNDKKLADYTPEEMNKLLRGKDGTKVKFGSGKEAINMTYEGLIDKFERLYLKRDTAELSESTRESAEAYITSVLCPQCHGARLNEKALASRIGGRNIAELSDMEATELAKALRAMTGPVAEPLAAQAATRVDELVGIGLGYLTLSRETSTLSGGESQRIKMVRHLNSALVDVLFIFDEPSIGLHPSDVGRLNEMLVKLRDKGNTVLVVEHDPDVMAIADHVVDVGPKAGIHGGEIVYEGSFRGLKQADTLTGRALREVLPMKETPRRPAGSLPLKHVTRNNLRDVSVDIPAGVLTVVTGVAGSGKSSLISEEFLAAYPDAVVIDQAAIGASSRSTPATYTNVMDPIRDLFARTNKAQPALFSFNSKGACPTCHGLGVTYTDLAFLDPITTVCETCDGKRFTEKVLAMTVRGRSIADVLAMSVTKALDFFTEKAIVPTLQALDDVGLGYITLGQSVSSLSGGERQRLKLATELGAEAKTYVLDEPTTGLHMSDTARLIRLFDRLVDKGGSVIIIEHNLDVIARADWIIDLGPGAGREGGRIVFEGPPAELVQHPASLTGRYLGERLAKAA
ncbi:MAG: excinuclease ABC subunit UvrA [Bauldia sp.]|nr:excinuclease ABC subunit UvrA [Bauldia sp.]